MTAKDSTPLMTTPRHGERSMPPHDIDARTEINVRGVIALRWVAVCGQFLTILVVQGVLGVALPLMQLFTVLGATGAINLALMLARRVIPVRWPLASSRVWEQVLGLSMLFDLMALTALLALTGGISNPFSLFYFVNIVLAAILLPRGWVWGLTFFGIACIAVLNRWSLPLTEFDSIPFSAERLGRSVSLTRWGSFVAYATCSSIIVSFITRIRRQIDRLEEHVRELAQAKARSERLDSLGTLAAGAAHELATPLSTIAIIVREVEQAVVGRTVTDQTVADFAIVRTELDRCRDILDRMSSDAGLVIGEAISPITLGELIQECSSGVDPRTPLKISFDPTIESLTLRAPLEGLAQAVRAIVKNAIDATGRPEDVTLRAELRGTKILMKIEDRGTGIAPETLRRIGEPFFTTKEPGKGMGLGIYLARNVIERLGGTIEYASRPGQGTVVSVTIPREFSANEDFSSGSLMANDRFF